METCVYFHKEEDFDRENRQTVEEDEEITVVDNDEIDESESEVRSDDDFNEDFRIEITTDKILEMYENVEMTHTEGKMKSQQMKSLKCM